MTNATTNATTTNATPFDVNHPAYYPNDVCECEFPCDAYGGCVNVTGTGHDPVPAPVAELPCCCMVVTDCSMYGEPCHCTRCQQD